MKNQITINIKDKDDYTSPYNQEKLHPELLSYILEEHKGIPLHQDIEIVVKSPKIFNQEEKEKFVTILRSDLGQDIKESYLIMKFILIRSILLLFFGILFIVFSFYLSKFSTSVISEVLLIIGWVGVWESTYILLFDNTHTRIKIKHYKKLVSAKVLFDENI